jgi:RHS repeat-associated protein
MPSTTSRSSRLSTTLRLLAGIVLAVSLPAAPAAATGLQDIGSCVQSQGYWSTHPAEWPVNVLVLGDPGQPAHTYGAAALLSLLRSPVRGDASINLAQQLIAARLNVAAGANPAPVADALGRADQLLGTFAGSLPYRVPARTPVGSAMTSVARELEAYNKGETTGACGTSNRAPLANAGPDQTVTLGATVTLTGAGSNDPDGQTITFRWSLLSAPEGSGAVLAGDTTASPTFVADMSGRYEVQLVVNDGALDSQPDTVVVSTRNSAPTADAGPDQTATVGTAVALSGAGSTDPDGDLLAYSWSFDSIPAGSQAVLAGSTSVAPSFTIDAPGAYVVRLVVSDGELTSTPDTVTISTINSPPVARAGEDVTRLVGEQVTLNGTASTDVDGDPLTYHWAFVTRPSGSAAALDDANAPMPSFVIDVFGEYIVQLTVNDGTVDSAADTVVVSTGNSPPVARAGVDQEVTAGAQVELDGSASSDVDGHPLTYAWSLVSTPAGSTTALSDAGAVRPTFVADLEGIYVAQLIVNDGFVSSAADTVSVVASVQHQNQPPTANAGLDQVVGPGTTVFLDGSGSSDPDADPLSYHWSLSRPNGSNASLSSATTATSSFVADVPGTYVAQLIVNDGTIDSAPDSVTVSTTNTPPVADAGPDQRVPLGSSVQLNGSNSSDANGTPLTYAWSILSQPSGGTATLSNPAAVDPTFTANVAGDYVVQLIVSDGLADSAPDTVVVTASTPADMAFRAYPLDTPPALGSQFQVWFYLRNNGPSPATGVTASIPAPPGLRYSHYAAATGTFDGSTWSIPNTIPSGTEYWITLVYFADTAGTKELTARVASSDQVDAVSSNDAATLVITPNTNADLRMSLLQAPSGTVTPGTGVALWFTVYNFGPANASNVVVTFPIPAGYTVTGSSAGANVYPGDYHPSTGVWNVGTLNSGTVIGLALSAIVNPTGSTALQASVSASSPDPSLSDNVLVFPALNRPPAAHAGASRTSGTYELVTLDGTGTTDPEGDPITFAWTVTLRPMSSVITLGNANTGTPAFTPDLPGLYRFLLTASDGRGGVHTSSVEVTAEERNRAPAIGSTPVTVGFVGAPYRYAIRATDPDAGDTLTYLLVTFPAGMVIDPSTGVIDWVPGATQGGPQAVEVRVRDAAGRVATQSWVVQVSSPANQAPVAADDAYDVRLGESLSVGAPGVLRNDTDVSPLTAALVRPPANGTVALNPDGSLTYTPYTQRPGEIVGAQGINLANRIPGVLLDPPGGTCPSCAVDDDPTTDWRAATYPPMLELIFPQDVTVTELRILPHLPPALNKASAGIFTLRDAQGNEIYNSGNLGLSAPQYYGRHVLPAPVAGVRRVRFDVTSGAAGTFFDAGFAEMQVFGNALLTRTAFVERNLAQKLATTVRASSYLGFNVPEAVNDGTLYNWYAASFNPGEYIEIAFNEDVTVSAIQGGSTSAAPDGTGSSLGYACTGTFYLLAADGSPLWDTGLVQHPRTPPGQNLGVWPFDFTVPNVAGVRTVRYVLASCDSTSHFQPGFSEIKVIGTSTNTAPAFDARKRLHALLGREVHSTPLVINLTDDNGDGRIDTSDVPDIVAVMESTTSQLRGEIKAVSGDDGRILFTAGGPDLVSPWSEVAAGDIDGDGVPEIVAVHADGSRLIAFEHTGEQKWLSGAAPLPVFFIGDSRLATGAVSIANLDGSGPPEIVVGATVFDATGRLVGSGGGTTGGTGLRTAISTVADIDLDGTPELVAGPTAYRLGAGGLSTVWQRTDRADGFAAVANFDDDPQAEIAMVANGFVYLLNHDGSDAANWNRPSGGPVAIPGGGQGGPPLVADVDGDGWPEIGVAGATGYVVFNRDGSVRWRSTISDRSSNSTGSVAFDLDGDGSVEIIYRDERFLRIYRGSDGFLLSRLPMQSSTWGEIPTVADVDNDGHADIIVSSDLLAGSTDSGVIVINDVLNLWKRTRRIWNQHAYHVTHVNEGGVIPVVETPHWLVPGLNAFRTNALGEGTSGDAADEFTYVASDGILQSNIGTVRIAVRPVNAAPRFTSAAITRAAASVAYTYPARAVDPDAGDLLTFSLPAAPAGMAIDSASGFIRWTPTAAQRGTHDVVVKVEDVRGLFALQAFSIAVGDAVTVPDVVGTAQPVAEATITAATLVAGSISTRNSPTVAAGLVISQSPAGGSLAAPGSAVNLAVSLGPAPAGTVPDVVGQSQPSAQADIVAAQFTLGAVAGQNSATVPSGIVMAQSPEAGTTAPTGSPIALVVSLGPPPGTLDLDLDGYTGNMGDCNDTDAAINPGAADPAGDGIDQNCNGVDSMAGDLALPTAAIASPSDLAEVTAPTNVVGTATDANFLRYTLQLGGVDEATLRTIGSGTTPVVNGVLGRIDPTLLENGLYRVRLIAEDVNGQTTIDERVYRVEGEAKVGVFQLSFTDLQVPLSGVPITVVRTYDSRVKTQRDFGVGWSLAVKTARYRHNRVPGDGWIIQDLPYLGDFLPCIGGSVETLSHLTEVRLSDREYYLFALGVENGNLGITGACEGVARFRHVGGTMPGATLDILDGTSVLYLKGGPNRVIDADAYYADGAERPYEPRRVRLTTIDGRVVEFDRTVGVTRIQDSNGNAVHISSAGIVHTSGRSIAFVRDQRGRITGITDPRGGELRYEYAIDDLGAFIDQAGNRTTFEYDAAHNLLVINDPLGNRAVRSEYDAEGRLIAIVDARGRRTEFTHELDLGRETITDAAGHQTHITYDARGNVLTREQSVTIDGALVPVRSEYTYDALGNETVILDSDNRRTENTWDALGNQLSSIVDPLGLNVRREASYSTKGYLLSETDVNGDTNSYVVDGAGNPTSWTDVDGRTTTVQHDADGNVTSMVDPDGRATQVTYDSAGRVVARTNSLGHVTNYTYDGAGNKLTESTTRTIDGVVRLVTRRFEYDALNRLVLIVDPLGRATRSTYNALGRVETTTDAMGRTTTFEYDEVGDLVLTTYPDGSTERREYDARGDLVAMTDREGLTTRYAYDELRRQISTTLPAGGVTRNIYSPGGRLVATIAPDGTRTDHEYDSAGRRVLTRLPAVPVGSSGALVRPEWRYEYEGDRLVAQVDPLGRRRDITYDAASRSVTVRLPDGTTATEFRDQWGRPVRRVDQEGREITFSYVADTGWLQSVTLPPPANGQSAVVWRFGYDEAGQRVSQTDPLGRVTRFVYDEASQLRRSILPGGEVRRLEYDSLGSVTQLTDYDGRTTTFEYDAAGRLVRRRFPDDTEVRFTYSPGGRRTTEQDARGTTSYHYDANGLLSRIDQPAAGSVEYSYDLAGRVTAVTTPSDTTSYTYDGLSRLSAAQTSTGTTSYRYDLAGNLLGYSMPNGVTATMAYDVRNQMTSLAYERAGTVLSAFGYTYTPAGRRATVTEPGSVSSFSYDPIGRLIGEARTGTDAFTRTYEYDLAGNRTRMVTNGAPIAYTYDVNDRMLSAGSASYAYDARGNLVSRNQAGAISTFAWTPDGRLASVTTGSGTVGFQYAPDGMRTGKVTAAGTVHYLIDRRNPTGLRQVLEERADSGALVARHQYGIGLLSSTRNGVESFPLVDGQTSVRQLADPAGQVTAHYAYDAFGNEIATSGSTQNDSRYIGQALDSETGLYYLRERYYDPGAGRFLGRDPVDGDPAMPLSLHRYIYAGNDPVNLADPNGDFFTLLGVSFSAIVDTAVRGIEVGRQLDYFCKVKGLAKIIPLAINMRQAVAKRSQIADALLGLVMPSFNLGSLGSPLTPNPSAGLSIKIPLYPASIFAPPTSKPGDLKSVEFSASVTSSSELGLELSATEFPNNSIKIAGTCELPSLKFKSFSGGIGREVELFDVRVCGVISVGTVSGTFAAGIGANGYDFSSSSFEAGMKLAAPFLPELSFSIVKLPDDLR